MGRCSKDWEDAIATSDDRAKNRFKASWVSGAAKGTQRSGKPSGRRRWGVAKTRPSAEKYPDERSANLKEMERNLSGGPDAEGMKKGTKSGRVRPRRSTPVDCVREERDGGDWKSGSDH